MNAVLIEDEFPAAERLQQLLRQHPEVVVTSVLPSVEAGIAWFLSNPMPDVVFSDIQLSDGLSFEIFEAVGITAPVIFTTSYDEYALKAFAVHSVDYLLKPIKAADLLRALDKLGRQAKAGASLGRMMQTLRPQPRFRQRFLIESGEQLVPVPVDDIAYFYTSHELVYLVRADGRKFVVDFTLEQLEHMLDPEAFFRVNRQVISRHAAIARIYNYLGGKLKLQLQPALTDEVVVSRQKAPMLKQWLEADTVDLQR